MAVQNYHRPTETQTAAELMQAGAVPLLLSPRPPLEIEAEVVVDLSQLGLSYIREEADGLHIGTLTPLQEIAASLLVRSHTNGILSKAAELSAHLGLRHIATLGGVLLSNDGAPEASLVLCALNTQVRFLDNAQAEISLAAWRENPAGRVPVAVRVPNSGLQVSSALERIARTPRDAAILAVAAAVTRDNNRVPHMRLAIGPNPKIYLEIARVDEVINSAAQLTSGLAELLHAQNNAQSDYLASAEYRSQMAIVLAQRAIEKAFNN